MTSSTFDERFALAVLDGEAILVEFDRGIVLLLNATAARVWQLHRDGHDIDACAAKLAAAHSIPVATIRRDVEAALDTSRVPVPPPDPDPFRYVRDGDRYVVSRSGEPVLENTPDGCTLRLCSQRAFSEDDIYSALIPLAPKLLALQGVRVLHASSVSIRGSLLAISGRSGAGKTTTARALIAAGAARISADKLVVGPDGITGVCDGEQRIHAWARTAARGISARDRRDWDCRSLRDCETGPTQPLACIAIVDAARRRPESTLFVESPMTHGEAAAALLLQTFIGTADPAVWRRNLSAACALAAVVRTVRLTPPDGLAALGEAARAYVSNSAS